MNTIQEYVDKMFKQVVKTEETEQLRIDILANMEDRYLALIEEGASENEAIGTVIVEFGNIEEVLDEMGLNHEKNLDEMDIEDVLVVELADAHEYIEARSKAGMGIGLGVLACSVGLGGLVSTFSFLAVGNDGPFFIGMIWLLIFSCLGVAQFIFQGLRLSNYKQYDKPFILVPEARDSIEVLSKNYKKSHGLSIVFGVVLCIFSLFPVIFGAFMYSEAAMFLGAGVMFVLASVGVLLFIYTGMKWTSYQNLLRKGKTVEEVMAARDRSRRKTKIENLLENIYWPSIVVLYMIISFSTNSWAWSWILFPIGGILESTIEAMFGIEED
ncbi:permease prefix domain 1-containing protein [Marinilactibacillus psychrotolerans]|uniref:permease prefix domain 1-containing protein n=1 Tax=Marinilactibacillus psychrotolerans TaxID=191770 RepID=UPI0038840D64